MKGKIEKLIINIKVIDNMNKKFYLKIQLF